MDFAGAKRDPWVWGQAALLLVILVVVPLVPMINLGWADGVIGRSDARVVRWLGLPLIVAGVGVVAWGVRSLGKGLTPAVQPPPEAQLIVTGPYAHCRHPIYLGVLLVIGGYTLAWSNWRLALVVGWGTLMFFRAKARAEERFLAARFPGYSSYQRSVPMILPWGTRRP